MTDDRNVAIRCHKIVEMVAIESAKKADSDITLATCKQHLEGRELVQKDLQNPVSARLDGVFMQYLQCTEV